MKKTLQDIAPKCGTCERNTCKKSGFCYMCPPDAGGVRGVAGEISENPGLSVDIGTTTLYASLRTAQGKSAAITRGNPQTRFGADVISRIGRALSDGGSELAACVRAEIADMVKELCAQSGVTPDSIGAAVITGNTAMLCLFCEHNPEPLSRAPFAADRLFGEYIDNGALGQFPALAPGAKIYLPRCISAFVGGDITTALIACAMCEREETAVLLDMGTNGEIALWHKGQLLCCSTAAGPAFEGFNITHGVYGIPGAIDHVWIDDGKIHCSSIGGGKAAGICGSGIIDAIAVMLARNIIDETGAFTDESGFFKLRDEIGITARDVRQVQLAKAAIRAGLETLLDASGIRAADVTSLYIAGSFGSFINLENTAAIGLIPRGLGGRVKILGNAAHTGASMLLGDKALIAKSERLAARAQTLALDANPVFAESYTRRMIFDNE
jgi:uncharacterized 2Fe-2S/4Fe-4S cluster protein (DUF4445 family)